jgi:hypothetical protein
VAIAAFKLIARCRAWSASEIGSLMCFKLTVVSQYAFSFTSVNMLCTMSRDFLPAPVAR